MLKDAGVIDTIKYVTIPKAKNEILEMIFINISYFYN
jgi:hypothetical protein